MRVCQFRHTRIQKGPGQIRTGGHSLSRRPLFPTELRGHRAGLMERDQTFAINSASIFKNNLTLSFRHAVKREMQLLWILHSTWNFYRENFLWMTRFYLIGGNFWIKDYFGQPWAGFFFVRDFFTASFQSPSSLSMSGLGPGVSFWRRFGLVLFFMLW